MKPRIQGSDSARIGSWFMFVGWIADDHFLGMLRPLHKLELRFPDSAPIRASGGDPLSNNHQLLSQNPIARPYFTI
ncbi:hypothetical protein V496_03600 [Pseudogymnoascus sp. VKM F-4515 (FW-2607)]|nr:hypothetical protein V496_03600 [Pseudogymnoascus sp. VKM F-4515 (FW-2607)]